MFSYDHTPFDRRSILADLRWLLLMWKLKRWVGAMGFSERARFWRELAPRTADGAIMSLPEAIPYICVDDLLRAGKAAVAK